jgi:outer membrane protein
MIRYIKSFIQGKICQNILINTPMNKMTSIIILLIMILPTISFSQKLKYGYVNAEKILSEMPEIELANKELEGYTKQINDYITVKNEEYKRKLADFQKSESSLSDLIKQDKQNELTKLGNDIIQFQQNAQAEINKKKQDLYKLAIDKLKIAIAGVAKDNAYRFIIDNSNGQLLYCEEEDNADNLVRKKLGLIK